MTESPASFLNRALSLWTPNSTYFDKAKAHRSGIESRLDAWLGLHEMFETGSLRHGTAVWLYSDVDYIVSLKGARPTPTTALNNVREALQDKYKSTKVRVSRPAVVCEFAGGDETVEVVPAYPILGGGYWIPDPKDQSKWMEAHPKDHNTWVNAANKKHSGAAKKLSRLTKAWKYKRSVPVSSCYLEMRAAKYADDQTTWILPMDFYYFLRSLQTNSLAAMNDPTGLGSRFTACSSSSTRSDALSKLATAVTRAEKAHDAHLAGNNADAVHYWKLVLDW